MKYVAYTRKSKTKRIKDKSTGEWVNEDDPLSHHFQAEEIRKYVGDSKLVVFSESDHSRDSSLESRPILSEALNAIKKGDTLIVWKSDRIVADQVEVVQLMTALEKKGATAVSVCEPNFFNPDYLSEFHRTIMVGINRLQVQEIRMRIKTALAAKKARGERVGHIPYGYRVEGKYLVPDEIEQANIGLMVNLYYERGLTYRELATTLNNEGIRNRGEREWSKSAVHRILSRRLEHSQYYMKEQAQLQRQ